MKRLACVALLITAMLDFVVEFRLPKEERDQLGGVDLHCSEDLHIDRVEGR